MQPAYNVSKYIFVVSQTNFLRATQNFLGDGMSIISPAIST
jgi:hypothetical protein